MKEGWSIEGGGEQETWQGLPLTCCITALLTKVALLTEYAMLRSYFELGAILLQMGKESTKPFSFSFFSSRFFFLGLMPENCTPYSDGFGVLRKNTKGVNSENDFTMSHSVTRICSLGTHTHHHYAQCSSK